MIINEFTCPADMYALNTEIDTRKIKPERLAAVMLVEQPGGGGMGSVVEKFRVLYWDDAAD